MNRVQTAGQVKWQEVGSGRKGDREWVREVFMEEWNRAETCRKTRLWACGCEGEGFPNG